MTSSHHHQLPGFFQTYFRITLYLYRAFHNSRPREKWALANDNKLSKNRNQEFTTAFITELQDL
jgi:hypothetical protein